MLMNPEDRADTVKHVFGDTIHVAKRDDDLIIYGSSAKTTRTQVEVDIKKALAALDFHMLSRASDIDDISERCLINTISDEDGFGEYVESVGLLVKDDEAARRVLAIAGVEDVFDLPPLRPSNDVNWSGMAL